MITFLQHEPLTGEIVRWGQCTPGDEDIQGDNVILEYGTPGTHYVKAGIVVAYTESQQATKSVMPTFPSQWSNASMSWVDQRTLAQHQVSKWATIKASRDAAITSPKNTSVGQFNADHASQNNLNKVISLVQLAQTFGHPGVANYTLATNVRVSLTLEQLQTASLEIGFQVQTLYDKADALRTQINAATDIAAVEAISWMP